MISFDQIRNYIPNSVTCLMLTVALLTGCGYIFPVLKANAQPVAKATSHTERLFQAAKSNYYKLERDPSVGGDRHNWLRGIKEFRHAYRIDPKSKIAPSSLYMIARMYRRMYQKFNLSSDIERAIKYYADVTTYFPNSDVADDALYSIAQIEQTDKANPLQASRMYLKLIVRYPDSNTKVQAEKELQKLKENNGINSRQLAKIQKPVKKTIPHRVAPAPVKVIEQAPAEPVQKKPPHAKNLIDVLPVQYWSSQDFTRVVIRASEPVQYSPTLLEKNRDLPRRLYIDFKKSFILPKFRSPVPIQDGLLKQIRTGQFNDTTVRVVLDLDSISDYNIYSLKNPFRVIIDVRGTDNVQVAQATSHKKITPLLEPEPVLEPKIEPEVEPEHPQLRFTHREKTETVQQQVDSGFDNLYGEGPILINKRVNRVTQQELETSEVQTEIEIVEQQEVEVPVVQAEVVVAEQKETEAPEIQTEIEVVEQQKREATEVQAESEIAEQQESEATKVQAESEVAEQQETEATVVEAKSEVAEEQETESTEVQAESEVAEQQETAAIEVHTETIEQQEDNSLQTSTIIDTTAQKESATPKIETGIEVAAQLGVFLILEDHKKTLPLTQIIVNESIPARSLTLAQQLGLGVHRIVIDPGHGGNDPGAMAFGLKEKNIVLDVAKRTAKVLTEKNYEVLLTRKDDSFLHLEERTAIANKENADLFLSIHVNAHPQESIKGVETFFLNLATNKEAMRVAARENATSTHNISELQGILVDLMQNAKINESSKLAGFVQTSLVSGLLENNYETKNLGVKQAPFYVLIGAEMPAILAEISFITNPVEAALLIDEKYLQAIAEQIAAGVISYVDQRRTAALDL